MFAPELLFICVVAAPQPPQAPVDFQREVRPILAANCFPCHGPDPAHRRSELRLDRKERAFAGGESGRAGIVPSDSAASELVRRVLSDDPEVRMPPQQAGRQPTDAERQLIGRWVDEGAEWREHWSFAPPERPAVPAVQRADWPRGDLDAFVLARLEREGLAPSPEADRYALIRRVTLDLTGLPPTVDEVRAFVDDPAPDAYERLVDRLMASPRFGEHMARYWLDAARYGDTHGLHLDNYREIWPFRDWVVRAFNDNKPYDEFVIEQIAGDLLPDATLDQRIATGFCRAHVTTNEGGSITEEVYVRNVVDRVDTFGTVFLGLTVGCAVCHDHKFDPVSQQEYYSLFAFFNNVDGSPMDGNAKAHAPVVSVPSTAHEAERAQLAAQLAELDGEIRARVDAFAYVEPPGGGAPPRAPTTTVWVDDELPTGAEPQGEFEWVTAPDHPVRSGVRSMRRSGEGVHQHFFENAPDQKLRIGAGDVLFAWVWLHPADLPEQVMLQFNADGANDWDHRAYWGANRIDWGKDGTGARHRGGDLPARGAWVRLEIAAQDVGLPPGSVVHGIAFTQFGGTAYWDAAGIESHVTQRSEDHAWIDDDLPSGAKPSGDGATWQWGEEPGQPVLSGRRSLRRSMGDGLNQDYFTAAAQPLLVRRGDVLFAHVWIDAEDPARSVQLQFHDGKGWEHRARWGDEAHGAGRQGGADFRAGDLPRAGQWVRLEVDPKDVGLAPGARVHGWAFTQVGGTVHWDRAGVHTWSRRDDRHLRSLAAWTELARNDGGLPKAVRAAANVAAADRTDAQEKQLRDHFVQRVFVGSRSVFDPLQVRREAVVKEREALDRRIPTTLVMKERAEPKPAFFLRRGQYDQKGEQVERVTPACLPPMAPSLPRDRLGLARWLVDKDHPLTARVAVNRFWQQVFGTGLVKTAEDFGSQGEPPTHPELLDWLAREFVASGWDIAALMRSLVSSATYRQSAGAAPAAWARDPENRLIARGSRYRLDAETMRDQALALGGLLVEKVGGPPVKPPQPGGLWRAVGYSSSNTAKFKADTGHEKVHRRSLYTFWKRTAPPPQMSTFDAPSREACVVRRERTNTPLQALLLMNDPQYVECARAFAARILQEGGVDDGQRAEWAIFAATGRPPEPADRDDLLAFVSEQRAVFAQDEEGAKALIAVGMVGADPAQDAVELAAWTMAANLLLNLDEVQSKGRP